MRIDHKISYKPNTTSISQLFRAESNLQAMQDIAIVHQVSVCQDDLGAKFKRVTAYLGYWPMFYAEAMVMNNPKDPMEQRVGEFAQGIAFGVMNSRRDQRHIVFQEAILFWDYLKESGKVNTTTLEMMHAVTDELSRQPQFQRILSDLFCLNGQNKVEDHGKAASAINAFLLKHTEVTEVLFKGLKGSFLEAMNTFSPEVWKPYSKTPARIDMRMGADLGL